MSVIVEAELNYGYDLGGGEHPWLLAGVGEGEPWAPDWLPEDVDIFEDLDDPEGEAEDILATKIAGFTEQHIPGDRGFWERRAAAVAQAGVRLDTYGWTGMHSFKLVTYAVVAYAYRPAGLTFAALENIRTAQAWDAKLDAALAALEMQPTGPRGYFLTATYSE